MGYIYVEEINLLLDETSKIPTPPDLDTHWHTNRNNPTLTAIDEQLITYTSHWGTPYGYKQEQKGDIVQNLFPIKKHETEQISSSSKVTLEMHTETAFHPWKPDYITLYCLRDNPHAGTTISHLEDILPQLSPTIIEWLKQPDYTIGVDTSFGNTDQRIPTSVLNEDATQLTYDATLLEGNTVNAKNALYFLRMAARKCEDTIYLKEGQALTFHNHTAIHGRTPYQARHDGTDRWLKRILTTQRKPVAPDYYVNAQGHPVITTEF